MKISKSLIKEFEQEQKAFGTAIALQNLILQLTMNFLEVTRYRITYKKKED